MTKTTIILGFAALAAFSAIGCDSRAQSDNQPPPNQPAKVSPPTTVPALDASATSKPSSAITAAPSFLFVKEVADPRNSQAEGNGQAVDPDQYGPAVEFPHARLRVTGKSEGNLVALLYSDDPKEAIEGNWQGDRYLFRMPLQISDRAALDGCIYRSVTAYEGAEESGNGVFLRGDKYHMEPVDLEVRFNRQGTRIVISVGGLLKQVDVNNPQAEPRWFHVRGMLQATPE